MSSIAVTRCTVPGSKRNASPGSTTFSASAAVALAAELDLRAARLDEPRLVLLAVQLQRQRVARLHEQQLPAVDVGQRPDQLVAPRLVDAPRLERPRRCEASALTRAAIRGARPGARSPSRSSFGVFTVSHRPSWRYARRRRSATSSGNVVVSWSPRSGSRSTASSEKT